MKYCIGCKYLGYADKKMGYGSPQTGSWTREEASMACEQDHWKVYLSEDRSMFDLEKAMEAAQSCPDFEERESVDQPTGDE